MGPAQDGRGAATVGPVKWGHPGVGLAGNGRSDGPNQVGQREIVGAGWPRRIVSGEGGGPPDVGLQEGAERATRKRSDFQAARSFSSRTAGAVAVATEDRRSSDVGDRIIANEGVSG